ISMSRSGAADDPTQWRQIVLLRLLFCSVSYLYRIRCLLLLRFSHGQKLHMARRKYERLDKAQSLGVQPSPDNFPAMFLAELTKGFCVNDLSLNSSSLDDPALQESPINPSLHFFCTNMQSPSQTMFRKPILSHARTGPEPMQHGLHRGPRAPEQYRNFLQRV